MKLIVTAITAILLMTVMLAACGSEKPAPEEETTEVQQTNVNTYEQITPEEAKKLMDSENNYIILDVRTQEEFDEAHIEGAILIPDYEIAQEAENVLKDKEQLILVYCRSGRRSKLAADELVLLGYSNVKEFGGIIDWPYGTVS